MKYKLGTVVIVVALALGALSGCKDKDKEMVETLGPICERSTEALANGSDLDGETFMQYLQNALRSCSAACDAKDDKSCTALGDHLEKLCKVTPDACQSFCESASGSLEEQACKQQS